LGIAAKVLAAVLLVPLCAVIAQSRRARTLTAPAAAATLLPALAWYVWAYHVIDAGEGSHASADNRSIWLHLSGPLGLFNKETLVWIGWFLLVRAFTPIGAALAVMGLCKRSHPDDRLFRLWGIAGLAAMVALAEKLHHEYYWLILSPVVAFGVAVGLDRIAKPHWRFTGLAGLALLCAIQARSTWRTPAEWAGLESAARTVTEYVRPDDWIASPEALLYEADRRGCRMEWTAQAATRAAGEWPVTGSVKSPADLLEYYREQGARYFADLGNVPDDPRRLALHEFVRRRYKVIVDNSEVIVADLLSSEIRPHAN
jgi:hypothetical protein